MRISLYSFHSKSNCILLMSIIPTIISFLIILYLSDFGDADAGSSKHVFACHNFLDYSGEARKSTININIEETMAILTRLVV